MLELTCFYLPASVPRFHQVLGSFRMAVTVVVVVVEVVVRNSFHVDAHVPTHTVLFPLLNLTPTLFPSLSQFDHFLGSLRNGCHYDSLPPYFVSICYPPLQYLFFLTFHHFLSFTLKKKILPYTVLFFLSFHHSLSSTLPPSFHPFLPPSFFPSLTPSYYLLSCMPPPLPSLHYQQ